MAGVLQGTRWPPFGTAASMPIRKESPWSAARQSGVPAAVAVALLTGRLRAVAHALARWAGCLA